MRRDGSSKNTSNGQVRLGKGLRFRESSLCSDVATPAFLHREEETKTKNVKFTERARAIALTKTPSFGMVSVQ